MLTPLEDKILWIMVKANRFLSTGEITKEVGMSWATVEKHLEILRAKSAVSYKWIGNAKYWRIHEERVSKLALEPPRKKKGKKGYGGD